jgi:hypothetical protein
MAKSRDLFVKSFTAPFHLGTGQFVLFPTNTAYTAPDYEAVIASREACRIWSPSLWPEDGFTLEENTADLALHVEDNNTHEAYGYMLFTLDKLKCLGSVYVTPLERSADTMDLVEGSEEFTAQYQARIDYWVREGMSLELESHITKNLLDWFTRTWNIKPLFVARPKMSQRCKVYKEQGLLMLAHLRAKDGSYDTLFFGRP